MHFKNYFESLSTIQKIESYLIVLILFTFVFIYFEDLKKFFYQKQSVNTMTIEQTVPRKNITVQYTPKTISDTELLDYLEKLSKTEKLSIQEYEVDKNYIKFMLEGQFFSLTSFLTNIEKYLLVKSFEISEESGKLKLQVLLKRKYFYASQEQVDRGGDDKSTKLITYKSPFVEYESINTNPIVKQVKHQSIKIMAIIDKEVLIDGKWYKKGDIVYGVKIVSVNKKDMMVYDLKKEKNIIKKINKDIL